MAAPTKYEFNAAQSEYLATTDDVVLYGGQAGAGKSFVALIDLLGLNEPTGTPRYQLDHYRACMYRKRRADLIDLIDKSKRIYPLVDPGAVYNHTECRWTFSSGAAIYLKYFERFEQAETFLSGQEFQCICAEEIQQHETDKIFLFSLSRLRSAFGLKCYARATCNPGRYRWLRDYFRIAPEGLSTSFERQFTLEDGTVVVRKIRYIRARLQDNKHLPADYQATLQQLSPEDREALLNGRWDAYDKVDGQIYEHELKALKAEGRYCRVPHDPALPTYTAWDLGINDRTSIIAYQIKGKEYRCINFASDSNLSIERDWIPLVRQWGYDYAAHYIPHDARQRDKWSGNSIEDSMRELLGNVEVLPTTRVLDGIQATRTMFNNLWIDNEHCSQLFDDLTQYRRVYDNVNNCYRNEPVHNDASHTADALRYMAGAPRPQPKMDLSNWIDPYAHAAPINPFV
jgi:hypothetical protein